MTQIRFADLKKIEEGVYVKKGEINSIRFNDDEDEAKAVQLGDKAILNVEQDSGDGEICLFIYSVQRDYSQEA